MSMESIQVGFVVSESDGVAIIRLHNGNRTAFLRQRDSPVNLTSLLNEMIHVEIVEDSKDALRVRHFRTPVYDQHVTPRRPLQTVSTGQQCVGIVRNVGPTVAYIDLGRIDALMPLELAEAVPSSGDVLTVTISEIDGAREKVFVAPSRR